MASSVKTGLCWDPMGVSSPQCVCVCVCACMHLSGCYIGEGEGLLTADSQLGKQSKAETGRRQTAAAPACQHSSTQGRSYRGGKQGICPGAHPYWWWGPYCDLGRLYRGPHQCLAPGPCVHCSATASTDTLTTDKAYTSWAECEVQTFFFLIKKKTLFGLFA